MTAQALYLKYRPQTFDEVVGQDPITSTLRNALRHGKVRHAYLFTGPRGTGKTTTARLLAKAVNCRAPLDERPCNKCATCLAINEGRLLDLIEIDAASNRGIDEIRDLREKVGFRPSEGEFKVYVLDEAHMLTDPAFNALLKTLEEPPPHVIFALVTTDPHKIPATIASRCQRFDFGRIPVQAIVEHLADIAQKEGVIVEREALAFIAYHSTGAMRDAISLLDQLTSYGDEITLDQAKMVLGTIASESAARLATCLVNSDLPGGLALINDSVGDGADPRQFGREAVEYLRGLLLVREGTGTRLLRATAEQAAEMDALAQRVSVEQLLRWLRLFNDAATDLKRGLQTIPQLPLELALVDAIVDPRASPSPMPAVRQGNVLYQTSSPATPQPAVAQPGPEKPKAAKQEASGPVPEATSTPASGDEGEDQAPAEQAPAEQAAAQQTLAGALTLAQVEQAWQVLLQAVWQRNPTTAGALRSQCKPVEVIGNEVIITFPYAFLKEKLVDPQRKAEIQDAMAEVLKVNCRIKLVKDSEYEPGPAANPSSAPSMLAQSQPVQQPADAQPDEQEVVKKVARWAEERGGQIKIVPPGN